MPVNLNPSAEKEAQKILDKLDSINFDAPEFTDWLKLQNFKTEDVGAFFHYKCEYGHLLFKMKSLGGPTKIIDCRYTPFDDLKNHIWLIVDGESTSGKKLSAEELIALQRQKYEDVENLIINIFAEVAMLAPAEITRNSRLQEDLLMEDFDIQDAIMKIEDELDCIIHDDDIADFETMSDVISFVRNAKGIKEP